MLRSPFLSRPLPTALLALSVSISLNFALDAWAIDKSQPAAQSKSAVGEAAGPSARNAAGGDGNLARQATESKKSESKDFAAQKSTEEDTATRKATEGKDSAARTGAEGKDAAARKGAESKAAAAAANKIDTRSWEDIRAEIEQKHVAALAHWELSKKYFWDWDWDLCSTELDLAVMDWPSLKVAHRDLCLLTFLSLNWPRSLAEFMMTVGLGDAIPLTAEEADVLKATAMTKHYKKGLQFARKADWPKTIEELNLAAELVPDDYVIHRSLAFAYGNLGQFDLAEAEYQKTFELAPEDGSAHADLAWFLADRGKYSEAQEQLEQATKASPKATAFHVDLGWMAESRGDLETASRELSTAVKLNPKQAGLWAHLGRVLAQKGAKQEAEQAFNQALALDPNSAEAKKNLARLKTEAGS